MLIFRLYLDDANESRSSPYKPYCHNLDSAAKLV